jgi:hypothetical protein
MDFVAENSNKLQNSMGFGRKNQLSPQLCSHCQNSEIFNPEKCESK